MYTYKHVRTYLSGLTSSGARCRLRCSTPRSLLKLGCGLCCVTRPVSLLTLACGLWWMTRPASLLTLACGLWREPRLLFELLLLLLARLACGL